MCIRDRLEAAAELFEGTDTGRGWWRMRDALAAFLTPGATLTVRHGRAKGAGAPTRALTVGGGCGAPVHVAYVHGAGGSFVSRHTIECELAYHTLINLSARLNDAACASVRPDGLCSW